MNVTVIVGPRTSGKWARAWALADKVRGSVVMDAASVGEDEFLLAAKGGAHVILVAAEPREQWVADLIAGGGATVERLPAAVGVGAGTEL